MSESTAHKIAAAFIAISLALTFINIRPSPLGSANPKSRFATIHNLVDNKTFAINKSPYVGTMDRIKIKGKLYSSKPPVLSVVTAGVYGTYHALTGRTMKSHEKQSVVLCIFFTVFLMQALMFAVFWKFTGLLCTDPRARLFGLAGLCFTWLGMGYATDLNNHTVSASLALTMFYLLTRLKEREENEDSSLLAHYLPLGFCAGLLPTIEIPALFLSVAAFILVVKHAKESKRAVNIFVFAAAALIPLIAHFALTYAITGSPLPAYLQHDLYERPLREWTNTIGFFQYAFHVLLGHHGFFTMTPLFLVSLVGFYKALKSKHRDLAIAVFLSFIAISLVYLSGNRNYGGRCVGFRWLLVVGPLFFLFAAYALEHVRLTKLTAYLLVGAFFVGGVNTQNGLYNPWRKARWQSFVEGLQK